MKPDCRNLQAVFQHGFIAKSDPTVFIGSKKIRAIGRVSEWLLWDQMSTKEPLSKKG
jgi:hypothetical protein